MHGALDLRFEAAAAVLALVLEMPCVERHVTLQLLDAAERAAAVSALVRLCACVEPATQQASSIPNQHGKCTKIKK